ncbi:uncharacterized protein LOC106130867 [Amyelois transitella]|uniref:uncharacterized protein LOC106130867 n=1 Tax=Amyelois transitella TaxID=680683 RepID=UPI00298F52A1|nr:uncharacterized protein LOC106130867 [Amyelois transitella]
MGIHCQINLFKPPDGAFSTGSTVSGVIKYGVDEVTVFDKIVVSLKGQGVLIVHDEHRRRDKRHETFRHTETYVDIDNITNNEKKSSHEIGMYETRFDFKLPDNIPSSLHYYGRNTRYRIKCNIIYYIRIKFERPGFLQFAKRFKKELTVVSAIKPTLLTEPVIYGEQKKLFQLFSKRNNVVKIKATIRNSVISPGGQIDLEYEVSNDTNLTINGVETKLVEIYTFKTYGGREIKMINDIDSTDSKTGSIKSDEKQNFDLLMNVPSDKTSLGFSNIVARNYFVRITTELPFPHINAVLEIPVEISDVIQENHDPLQGTEIGQGPPDYNDPPPSYWVVMGEESKDDEFESEKEIEKL